MQLFKVRLLATRSSPLDYRGGNVLRKIDGAISAWILQIWTMAIPPSQASWPWKNYLHYYHLTIEERKCWGRWSGNVKNLDHAHARRIPLITPCMVISLSWGESRAIFLLGEFMIFLLSFSRQVNLMDPQQTDLPQFDLAHLNCVAGGPYQVKLANGYITSIQVWQMGIRIILIYLTIIIRSKMLLGTMAKGSGGMTCQLTTMILVRWFYYKVKLNVYHPCLVTQRHSGLSVRANKPAWTLRPCQVRAVGGTSQSPIGAKAAQCPQVCGQLQRLHTVPTSQPTQQYSWAKPPPTVSWGCRVSPCSVLWSFQGPRVSSRGSRCWSLRPRRHCPVCWLCSATVSGNNPNL